MHSPQSIGQQMTETDITCSLAVSRRFATVTQ